MAAIGWRDANGARSDLVIARETLSTALDNPAALSTSEGRADTRRRVSSALRRIATARRRIVRSPVLSAIKGFPVLGTQRGGLLRLVDDANAAATAGQALLADVDTVAAQAQIKDGTAPLESIGRLSGRVRATSEHMASLRRTESGLLRPLNDARKRFDELIGSSADRLVQAADALDAAQGFMGATQQRSYMVALENNTEMRDQGAVLAFVDVGFDRGRLSFGESGSIRKILLDGPAPTPIPSGTEEVFGSILPTTNWQSVNATADFGWSGQAMADMYRHASGRSVDGVIAIDLPGLRALLQVVGPVQVSTLPEPVTPENIYRILGHDIYDGLTPSGDPLRQERYSEMTRAVIDQLTNGSPDAVLLGAQLGTAAKGGHLRLWSRNPDEERVFERTGLGGGPGGRDADRTFHLAVENRTPTKLDYYVAPAVRAEIEVSRDGTAIVRTTATVQNRAPVGAPPSYQLGPDGVIAKQPGDYVAWVLLWGPEGATQPGAVAESGLQLSQHVIGVPAGEDRELTFETKIPHAVRDGRLVLRFVPQPRLYPVDLSVTLQAPGWSIEGDRAWRGPWDRTIRFEWRAEH